MKTLDAALNLSVSNTRLAVCRLKPDTKLPAWAAGSDFFSVTRTPDEPSVVCPEDRVPQGIDREGGWRALKIEGPLEFSLVGVLSSVAAPLVEAGVSIFVVSTFDTDYVLVKDEQLGPAVAALRGHGHEVL